MRYPRRLALLMIDVTPLGVADFAARVKSDAAKWKSVVSAVGAQVD